MRSHILVLTIMILCLAALMSCSADAPQVEAGSAPVSVPGVRIIKDDRGTAMSVCVVELPGGQTAVVFGNYSRSDPIVLVVDAPGQPMRLVAPLPPTAPVINPPVTLLPVVTHTNK